MSNQEPAIIVKNVKKSFKIPLDKSSGIKDRLIHFYRRKKGHRNFQALNGVSFEIKKGEFVGIVGRNGSGKSTLLKILAGVYSPDSGGVAVNGSLTPFIELGVGFNPELTGRENVFLNGALLGFSKKEMEKMYDSIVDFAELHEFMEERLKNYSSGMQVRLAFSIAIRADADILVLDEVLAVGDEAFQRKCYEYFAKLKKENKTVILVTHSMDNILQFCTRAILVDNGKIIKASNPLAIARAYKKLNSGEDTHSASKGSNTENIDANVTCTKENKKIILDMTFTPKNKMEDAVLGMGIYRETGEQIFHWASDEKKPAILDLNTQTKLKIELLDVFPVGKFSVSLFVRRKDRSMDYATFNNIVGFEVKNLTPYQYATRWKVPECNYINGIEVKNVY